jgi:hypothetical protein
MKQQVIILMIAVTSLWPLPRIPAYASDWYYTADCMLGSCSAGNCDKPTKEAHRSSPAELYEYSKSDGTSVEIREEGNVVLVEARPDMGPVVFVFTKTSDECKNYLAKMIEQGKKNIDERNKYLNKYR